MEFTLGNSLDELGITKNKLSTESQVRYNTISDLVNGNANAVRFDSLEAIIDALNSIALEKGINKIYKIDDVIQYIKKS
ncbi:XRE family transcriptional regulator [Bacillus wiedmannii]|uniref:helix-turn-helix domain-containing protein n=1 Tax=Bacillus wiedmannii TaxID=1890302 RepID=UPI000BF2437E|nr:helix-turn-helix domain-containing protein [Bacillus wiedmannii]PEI37752.1 XRE family transcriptional regulator [Bacillus wiedmannii]PEL95058.1 XRE family transcriptional regulator [Bacillus wiedmannii]PEN96404.1 XRE family transcriptional regulator [Bacillus wiedmannii]